MKHTDAGSQRDNVVGVAPWKPPLAKRSHRRPAALSSHAYNTSTKHDNQKAVQLRKTIWVLVILLEAYRMQLWKKQAPCDISLVNNSSKHGHSPPSRIKGFNPHTGTRLSGFSGAHS